VIGVGGQQSPLLYFSGEKAFENKPFTCPTGTLSPRDKGIETANELANK
jgi:hypothetical protein